MSIFRAITRLDKLSSETAVPLKGDRVMPSISPLTKFVGVGVGIGVGEGVGSGIEITVGLSSVTEAELEPESPESEDGIESSEINVG